MRYIVLLLSLFILSFPSYSFENQKTHKTKVGTKKGVENPHKNGTKFHTKKLPKSIVLTEKNSARLLDSVDIDNVAGIIRKMSLLAATPVDAQYSQERDLYLILLSPGGSIFAGLQLIDSLASLHGVKIHTITIYSASMSFMTSQFLGTRYITRHGEMMSHLARGSFNGEFPGQLDSRYNFYMKRVLDLESQVVKRTNGKQTKESYAKLRENEYYCEGQKCIDDGFADEIANVRCSASLLKEKVEVQTRRFFGMKIERKVKSNRCPIIMGTQTLSLKVNGKEYDYSNLQLNEFIKELESPKFTRK